MSGFNFIQSTSWEKILNNWQAGFMENQPYEAGAQPSDSMQNILEMQSTHIALLDKRNISTNVTSRIASTITVKESIYLLHKAGAILRSYNGDIERHDQTYSEISAYTASFFLARGINLLLGCFLSTTKIGSSFVVSEMRKDCNIAEIKIHRLGYKPGHFHVWKLLKKLIENTNDLPIDNELNVFMDQIDAEAFPEVRNKIQYHNCEWTYNDLHIDDHDSKDWIEPFNRKIYLYCNSQDPSCHFSTTVSLILFRAMYLLLDDLCTKIPCLCDEKKLVIENMKYCNSTLFTNSWI